MAPSTKRKADQITKSEDGIRRTRSSGRVEVVVPLFAWDKDNTNTPKSTPRKKVARHSAPRTRPPPKQQEHHSTEEEDNQAKGDEQDDSQSEDDLDMLSSPTRPRRRPSPPKLKGKPLVRRAPAPSFPSTDVSQPPSDASDQESFPPPPPPPKRKPKITARSTRRVKRSPSVTSRSSEAAVESQVASEDDDEAVAGPSTSTPATLSASFHRVLVAQRKAMLRALLEPPTSYQESGGTALDKTLADLKFLLAGSTQRGEGNSCLVLGPKGSGKSRVVAEAIESVRSTKPIIIRLSGEAQQNDKLAMREMARQLVKQAGSSFLLPSDETEADGVQVSADNIPTTQLQNLIATFTTLPRSIIVLLESFEIFAGQARQEFLYSLFDTAQSWRPPPSGGGTSHGLAVIGITAQHDALNLLEKRVKSRFSQRVFRVAPPNTFESYVAVAGNVLKVPIEAEDYESEEQFDLDATLRKEWVQNWETSVETFLAHKDVKRVLANTYDLRRDSRSLCRVLTPVVLGLSPNSPTLRPDLLKEGFTTQLAPPSYGFLSDFIELPYPCMALLIAAYHISNTGHDTFNFEMIWHNFSRQVDRTGSMPVVVDGASVGMIKVPKDVMVGHYERLISLKVFQPIGPPSANVAKPFVKHRCEVGQGEIVDAVERCGNLKLKTWLKRAAE